MVGCILYKTMSDSIQDPENYAKMAEPFESQVDATVATQGFMNDVLLARQKWRIPEVLIGCAAYCKKDSKIQVASLYQRMGDFMQTPWLLQQINARVTQDLLEKIAELNDLLKEENAD